MKIGFIGFGSLGTAMAKRLIAQNFEIVGWNRTKGKLSTLPIIRASAPDEVINQTDIIVLNLFDSDAVQSVLTGQNGVLGGNCGGKLILDTTTNHFKRVVQFHSMVGAKGASYLEAPVLGSVIPAAQGTLTILVSGDQAVYERATTILSSIGKTIFYFAEPGLATKMKLVNNLVLGSFMATIAEAVLLGESVGVSKEKVLDILSSGAGNSGVLNAKKEKLLKEEFAPHFSVAALKKDIGYLMEMNGDIGRQSFMGDGVNRMLDVAIRNGYGYRDISSLYAALKKVII